nr:hypothetical protein [Tessaracoccus sp.]
MHDLGQPVDHAQPFPYEAGLDRTPPLHEHPRVGGVIVDAAGEATHDEPARLGRHPGHLDRQAVDTQLRGPDEAPVGVVEPVDGARPVVAAPS